MCEGDVDLEKSITLYCICQNIEIQADVLRKIEEKISYKFMTGRVKNALEMHILRGPDIHP